MKLLFFDTETTGLPADWKAPVTDLDNWPRVIELGWALTDTEDITLQEASHLIQPEGWVVPTEEFWTSRNMTTERCLQEGRPMREVALEFLAAVQQADLLIAHNMEFDSKVMGAEAIRLGITGNHRPVKLCTKTLTTAYCKIKFNGKQNRYPGSRPQHYKWPTLEELWGVLFGKNTLVQDHRAGGDVRVLRTCFFELVRRHVIRYPAVLNATSP